MIKEFRLNYPQGSLTSDLIAIEHGKYIVKVTVASGSQIMATGLAAATTIEEAEDKARNRALATLSFPEEKIKPQPQIPSKSPNSPALPMTTSSSKDSYTPPPVINSSPPPEKKLNSEVSENFVADTIAEINLQMKRLNWTKEQGTEYLLKTYGKKSRHLLSDEELLEFLAYLQNQPES